MQRILFITERFPPDIGGVARSAERIVSSLIQLGIVVDVLTWSRYLQPGEVIPPDANLLSLDLSLDSGKKQDSVKNRPRIHRIGLYRQWDMTLPHTLSVLDWLHQTHPYDAVWGHYLFPAGFLATWFAQLNNLPGVVSARGNDVDLTVFPPGDFARLQWTLANAAWVTAVSQEMARKIQVLSGRTDVILLKNTVDTTLFSPLAPPNSPSPSISSLRRSLGIADDEWVLGFSGELREKKGQQFLFPALTHVRSHHPACLLIIGEVRASSQAVVQNYAIAHPDDAKRLIITGHLDSPNAVAQHLQLCDVYLQPSLWEGMPNALLEAMACSRCCIASDAGGISEVMEHGRTGFLLPRAQLHHLGDAILECLELSPNQRQAIGQAAHHYIKNHCSLTQEQEQLRALIDRVFGQ